jgi:ABC-2 type transport system permease protein
MFVRIYWVLLCAGSRRQAFYRLALLSGVVTNAFFGVIRTSVFSARYRNRPEVAGLVRGDVLTYTWLLEGMFGVIWASWVWEFAESVRSGDFAIELLRPSDPYLRLAAFDQPGHGGGDRLPAPAAVRDGRPLDARLQGRVQA